MICLALPGCYEFIASSSNASTPALSGSSGVSTEVRVCPVSQPEWIKPPEDSSVQGSSSHEYFFVNQDRSIWASAWWTGEEETYLRATEEGIKVGWFRPAGAELQISGRRLDGESEPLHVHIPCCYRSRFQATGLFFPTAGCWEVTAKAVGSELSFIVNVKP